MVGFFNDETNKEDIEVRPQPSACPSCCPCPPCTLFPFDAHSLTHTYGMNKHWPKVFEEVASANRYNYRFAYSVEDDVREHFKGSSGCAVFVYLPPRFLNDKYDKPKV